LLFPMYHPAYVIRCSYTERRYARDFRRLANLLRAAIAD
jgi:uracil-DNA glycosylase